MQAKKQVSSGSDHVRIDPKRPKRKRKRGKGKSIKKTIPQSLGLDGLEKLEKDKETAAKD